jgi:hypothetical protein
VRAVWIGGRWDGWGVGRIKGHDDDRVFRETGEVGVGGLTCVVSLGYVHICMYVYRVLWYIRVGSYVLPRSSG